MFWSSDLLSIQGGKFSKIWHLGSEAEGAKSEVKLYDIQGLDIKKLVEDFYKFVPVTDNHCSLRVLSICGVGFAEACSRKSVFLLEQVNNARSGGKGGAGTNKKGEKQRRKSEGGTKKKEVPKEGIDAPPTSAKKVTLAEPPQDIGNIPAEYSKLYDDLEYGEVRAEEFVPTHNPAIHADPSAITLQEDDFNWPGNDPNRNQDEDFGFGQEGLGGPQGADLFADDPHPLFGTEQQVAPELLPDQPPEETVNSGRPDDPSQQQHEEPSNREHNADLNEGVAAPKRKTRAEIDALSDSVTNSTAVEGEKPSKKRRTEVPEYNEDAAEPEPIPEVLITEHEPLPEDPAIEPEPLQNVPEGDVPPTNNEVPTNNDASVNNEERQENEAPPPAEAVAQEEPAATPERERESALELESLDSDSGRRPPGGERRGVGAGRRRRLIIDRVKQIPEADLREQIAGGPYRENLMTVKGRDQFDQSLSNVKYGPEHQIRFDKGTKKNKFFASSIRSSEPVRINNFRGHVFSRLGENAPGANFFDFTGNDENGGWHQDMPAGQESVQEAPQPDPIDEVQQEEPVDEQQPPPLQLEDDNSQWDTINTSPRENAAPSRPSNIRGESTAEGTGMRDSTTGTLKVGVQRGGKKRSRSAIDGRRLDSESSDGEADIVGRPPLLSSTHADTMNPDDSSVVRDGRSTVLPNETSGKEVVGKRLRGKGRSSTAQQQEEPEAQETHDTVNQPEIAPNTDVGANTEAGVEIQLSTNNPSDEEGIQPDIPDLDVNQAAVGEDVEGAVGGGEAQEPRPPGASRVPSHQSSVGESVHTLQSQGDPFLEKGQVKELLDDELSRQGIPRITTFAKLFPPPSAGKLGGDDPRRTAALALEHLLSMAADGHLEVHQEENDFKDNITIQTRI